MAYGSKSLKNNIFYIKTTNVNAKTKLNLNAKTERSYIVDTPEATVKCLCVVRSGGVSLVLNQPIVPKWCSWYYCTTRERGPEGRSTGFGSLN